MGLLHAFDLELDELLCNGPETFYVFPNDRWAGPLGEGALCEECFAEFIKRTEDG
jgi:hypothetical protein